MLSLPASVCLSDVIVHASVSLNVCKYKETSRRTGLSGIHTHINEQTARCTEWYMHGSRKLSEGVQLNSENFFLFCFN